MAGQGARHLRSAVGKFVRVSNDDSAATRRATLVAVTPRGVRVRYSDGAERTVAAWRITVESDAR